MRKYLAIVLSVIFILGFSITAFAVHAPEVPDESVVSKGPAKITLGGKILVRGWYFNNVTYNQAGPLGDPKLYNLPEESESQSVYTTNANLTVDAKIGNAQGFMELETSCFGNANCGLYYWGGGSGQPNGTYDTKPNADLFFRQLWIQYTGSGLLGVPLGIKAGHMPITLGEKQFLNNERFGDDAILVWVDPTKDLHILLGTTKLAEGDFAQHRDDLDGYVGLLTYAVNKDITLGVNYTWVHSDDQCPSLGPVDSLNFSNVGIHGNGKVGGLSFAAEADFQFGEVEGITNLGGADREPKGWAAYVKLAYMLDPVNIRASFAYGSGDDDANDEDCEEFQTLQGPDEIGPLARYVHYTQIYERTVSTAAETSVLTTRANGNTRNTGIANTTYVNLGLDVNPMKELAVSLDGFYLMASETGAWEDLVGHDVDDSVGLELDSKITYKIAKNLSYFIEAAAFWPGDFYEDVHGVDHSVVQMLHGLLLTF